MRISDWSSDVCSSDLCTGDGTREPLNAGIKIAQYSGGFNAYVACLMALLRRARDGGGDVIDLRSEEHTSELQSLMRISYAVFCLKRKNEEVILGAVDIAKTIKRLARRAEVPDRRSKYAEQNTQYSALN